MPYLQRDNFKKFKVNFILKPTIIIIEDEDRKGPWELLARDRDRFKRRIREFENKIGWCFQPLHREKMFRHLHQFKQDIPVVSA